MSAEDTGRRPDLLLIVLDCVRASDFPGGRQPIGPMPFVDRLARESIHFPRAASVAHWTVPAHATMFTGLYPWEHGVHAKGRLLLDASVPRVAEFLREEGYRTLSLSANGLVSPGLGLTGGFDRAAWGVSLFNRLSDRPDPPLSLDGESERGARIESTMRARYRQLSYWAAVVLARYPVVWDGGTRVTAKMRHPGNGYRPQMSNWLEPTLGKWLKAESKDRPTYTFINLLDAHEPYLYDPEVRSSLRAWWEFARTRQDRLGWVVGDWKPSPEEFRLLHELYRGMIRAMDRRLEKIVRAYQDAGRWENTMMILTSDHGQAFGEHGALFHILGVDEPEIRVPLFLRPPGGLPAPKTAKGWASLLDIPTTLLAWAGARERSFPSSPVTLDSLVDQERPGPVFAMSDGIVHDADRERVPLHRRQTIDRLVVAGYEGNRKVVLDLETNEYRAYDPEADPLEATDLAPAEGPELASLVESTRAVGRKILGREESELSADVEDRLRSWGYI